MLIRELQIKNYRSLRDLKTPSLPSAVVFHGANNSGKSNILLALHTIFSAKSVGTGLSLPQEVSGTTPPPPDRKTPFWQGVIFNFADSFYMGTANHVDFSVRLEVPASHFEKLQDVALLNGLLGQGHEYQLKLVGKINRFGADGEIVLDTAHLNNKPIFNRRGENVDWFPSLDASVEATRKRGLVEAILDTFTDSVYVVPANRYLMTNEIETDASVLSSNGYKNWLHRQSLSRDGFEIFKAVRKQLSNEPFGYGEISFINDGRNIDIMVDDGLGFRMPIAQKGTGVQQILVLLGYIATSQAYVIGIEEPELNLSFKSQDDLINSLLRVVKLPTSRASQILLASHSDYVGSRTELKQIRVENLDGRATTVRTFTLKDRADLFPRSRGLNRKLKTSR